MHGSKGYQPSDAEEKPDRGEAVLSLTTVKKMLPLVQRVVEEIRNCQIALETLQAQEDALNRKKRTLAWPERQRRYRLQEEHARVENDLLAAREELDVLGVMLLDLDLGRVGFPTMVNNRKAFFSWRLGEDNLHSWHFAEETQCRPIPPAWLQEIAVGAAH
jgi:hypothetical protein